MSWREEARVVDTAEAELDFKMIIVIIATTVNSATYFITKCPPGTDSRSALKHYRGKLNDKVFPQAVNLFVFISAHPLCCSFTCSL
jgi:hypothetical protein